MKRVGIIGCGAIGTQVALAIDDAKISDTILEFLFDTNPDATKSLAGKLTNSTARCFSDFSDLISSTPFKASNLVLESASQAACPLIRKEAARIGKGSDSNECRRFSRRSVIVGSSSFVR